jgi:two-component system, cell cycle response regulator CpdR
VARILIADDEEAIRSLAARALSQDGHEVTTAGDGAEAIDALGRQPFDLLLADIRMPVMDGIALALATARDHPGTTIVLMTGYADQRERASGLSGSFTACSPSRLRSRSCARRWRKRSARANKTLKKWSYFSAENRRPPPPSRGHAFPENARATYQIIPSRQ